MVADCLFCKIVAGDIPSHKVYEDDTAFAFLDIKPLARGHALVVPRTHAERFEDLAPEVAGRLWRAVHKLTPAIARAVGAPATTLAINNGREAGQEVGHVHIHIVPRTRGDEAGPIHALFGKRPSVSDEALVALAQQIRAAVAPVSAASPRRP